MNSIGVLWAQYGPYHYARLSALKRSTPGAMVHGIEMANFTSDYQWRRTAASPEITTLCPGCHSERLSFAKIFRRARTSFSRLGIQVCLLPSYSPKQSFAALLAARSLGIRTVMMNESHRGTSAPNRASALLKWPLLALFDAALVGGTPHRRHFAGLGFAEHKIFMGYDAIDNDYFFEATQRIRLEAASHRVRYDLPERYFLSLGRFVPKKNLPTLVRAYRLFLDASSAKSTHLVFVGSGPEEAKLKSLCQEYDLPVYGKEGVSPRRTTAYRQAPTNQAPGVHFYGFRQIDENPIFYALANAFILPSSREEWGLVVNEAMASGLPVVVSEAAGCAEDLLEPGQPGPGFSPGSNCVLERLGIEERLRRNGLVFDPKSSDQLSRVLLFLDSAPELQSLMGKASQRVIERFSCENFARNALLAARAAMRKPHRRAANARPA